jgi:hypothetical protein
MLTSSLTLHSKDCDVWQNTINLATEKSKLISRTVQQSALPILSLDCMSAAGDLQIVEVVCDWNAKGFVGFQ